MNYLEPLPQQLTNFLLFFAFGFLAGFLFRVVELLRSLFSKGKRALFLQDFLFSVAVTILMFVFLLVYADGNVRLNLIFASALGAAAFFLTADRAVKRVFGALSAGFSRVISLVSAPFIYIFQKSFQRPLRSFLSGKKRKGNRRSRQRKRKRKKSAKKKFKNLRICGKNT